MLLRIKRAEKTGFLSLKEFGLKEIPPQVFTILSLHTLILSQNPIQSIPAEIKNLKKLKILHLVKCELTDDSIPVDIKDTNIEDIDISYNNLSSLSNILSIASLKKLSARHNDILSIQPSDVRPH